MTKRCVIIGSGLGGLSSGVILAKNGYDVTVLEKHFQIGGCLQCFCRDGVKFETGMHFIGSADKGQTMDMMFKYLEVDSDVALSRLDETGYDIVSLAGKKYRFANERNNFISQMLAYFPDSENDLNEYCNIIDKVSTASSLHSLQHTKTDDAINNEYLLRSIDDVLNEVIHNDELRNVLVGNLPLYAAEKGKTSFSTHAFVADFYNKSAYRIVGGSDLIAKSLAHTIERYGGKVLTRKNVVKLECDDTHAFAVVTDDSTRYDADVFISDLHPARTIELTDSPLLRNAYRKRVKALPNTVGCFTVYIKFKDKTQHYMNSNFYGYAGDSPWNCEKYTDADWPKGYLYMHFCDNASHEYANSGLIISYMQYDDVVKWEGTSVEHRSADYEQFKKLKAEKLLESVERDFPCLRDNIESYYTSTPLTYRDYTGTEVGGMYGIARDVTLGPASRVHHRTKIPNLLLTGQNVNSHGILGVLVGTIVTCGELISSEEIIRQMTESIK